MEGAEYKYQPIFHKCLLYRFRSLFFLLLHIESQRINHPKCLYSARKHFRKESKKALVGNSVTVLLPAFSDSHPAQTRVFCW